MTVLKEESKGYALDPLSRWIPLPLQRLYRVVDNAFTRGIFIRTNSELLFQSLALLQNGDLHAADMEPDFFWDIVVEEETVEVSTSQEISISPAETMYTAYFGRKSFFALSLQHRYAAGFLSLSQETAARKELVEEYLTLLHQFTRDAFSGGDLCCAKAGMS